MKAFITSFGAAALLTFSATGQVATLTKHPTTATATGALSPDEQLFTTLLEKLGSAIEKHDMTALAKYMAPEYVHYNPNNSSGDRTEELAYLATWPATTMKIMSPVKVNHYGSTAITVATTTFSSQENGKTTNTTIQMMIAWVLRDGQWQMAVVQSKSVPA
jgi:hypothetical protein